MMAAVKTEKAGGDGGPQPRKRLERPPVEFEPISPLRAHEYVAEQIRRHIALRLISPGEALPSERELAATFEVGRPTVQHALRLLEADDLLTARRGRGGGTVVSAPSDSSRGMDGLVARVRRDRDEIEQTLVFRRVVEPQVARLAATTRRKADLVAMRRSIAEMTEAPDEDHYMRYDTELHLALARATRNSLLLEAIELVRLQLNDAFVLQPESDLWHRRIATEHDSIVDAVEARDGDAAGEAMEAHIESTEKGVRALLAWVRPPTRPRATR